MSPAAGWAMHMQLGGDFQHCSHGDLTLLPLMSKGIQWKQTWPVAECIGKSYLANFKMTRKIFARILLPYFHPSKSCFHGNLTRKLAGQRQTGNEHSPF